MAEDSSVNLTSHRVVSRDEWLAARKELLAKEKDFTRLRDDLTRRRRELPWVKVEKPYKFDGPKGEETLPQLFENRTQLVIYHFMFNPAWEAGCPHCSHWADNFNGVIVHLNQRDVTMIAVSRAPHVKLAAYKARMGWSFTWVSSGESDFNFDYGASFTAEEVSGKQASYNFTVQDPRSADREGVSVFYKDPAGDVFHTYSTYARGIDMLNVDYQYLDLVPRGRDEGGRGPYWVRRHDEYGR